MSTIDRLRADFAVVADRFHANPACARLRRGPITRAEYASLLASVARLAREGQQVQAYATAFFRGGQRASVSDFVRHALSELGHDGLAAADVARLGYRVDDLFRQPARPATVALTAFAYYTIDHHDPIGYLGYLFFLESLPKAFAAEYLAALDRAGIPDDARTFLVDHVRGDDGADERLERYVGALVGGEGAYRAVRYAMEVTGALYARMVEEAFELAGTLEVAEERPAAERPGGTASGPLVPA
jgi:hypothetical protein